MSITIGIDIGGTFTDVVSLDNESGELQYTKVNSTPPRLVDGFMKGADSVRRLASASFSDVSRIAHGTTIGTNAILEARGSTIGILTTKGFEDVLTIGRQKRSDMYDVFIEPETPVFLAPRRRIFGIEERIYANGGVDVPLNEADVATAVETLVTEHDVEAIAVCYLFSFANAAHEERTRDIILGAYPDLRVSLSSELDPRFREYERLCLTAFDAYLRPVLERYIQQVRDSLSESGVKARLHIIHSRGGITSDETILSNTVSTVLSGPAAGVIGGVHAGKLSDLTDLITLDMGGTSCDISLVDKGKPVLSNEGKIAKYPLRQPMLDINTIGAGGGSIAWVDGRRSPEGRAPERGRLTWPRGLQYGRRRAYRHRCQPPPRLPGPRLLRRRFHEVVGGKGGRGSPNQHRWTPRHRCPGRRPRYPHHSQQPHGRRSPPGIRLPRLRPPELLPGRPRGRGARARR